MMDGTLLYVVLLVILVMETLLYDNICDLGFIPRVFFFSSIGITHLFYGAGEPKVYSLWIDMVALSYGTLGP
jgi:hypothetical protein